MEILYHIELHIFSIGGNLFQKRKTFERMDDMADENKLQALRISPGFLDNLQKERNLSHGAFLAACGLNQQRYDELCEGSCPSYLEFSRIVDGFGLATGVPMVPVALADVA